MRQRGKCQNPANFSLFGVDRTRSYETYECENLAYDQTDRAIVDRSVDKLILELDFGRLDFLGTFRLVKNGIRVTVDEYKTGAQVDRQTGELLDIGNTINDHFSFNEPQKIAPFDLFTAFEKPGTGDSEQPDTYMWLSPPNGVSPGEVLLADQANQNIQAALKRIEIQ